MASSENHGDKLWKTPSALLQCVSNRIPPCNCFDIPPIREEFVARFLSNLDVKKAIGLDNVSARILKLCSPFIAHVITYICNLSIKSNTFPDAWKTAKIKPLLKKGSTLNLNNYRPISILPTLSKVLEKHVAIHLYEYLNGHELLSACLLYTSDAADE